MQCPHCNRSLSVRHETCPYCGQKIAPEQKPSSAPAAPTTLIWVISWVILIAGCGLIFLTVGYIKNANRQRAAADEQRVAAFVEELAATCQAASTQPVAPGKIKTAVYSYVMNRDEVWPPEPAGVQDWRSVSYIRLAGWLEGQFSGERKAYTASTVLCLKVDDILVRDCKYMGAEKMTYQQHFEAFLVDLSSGSLRAKNTFTGGGAQGDCPSLLTLPEGSKVRTIIDVGEAVTPAEVLNWIKTLQP